MKNANGELSLFWMISAFIATWVNALLLFPNFIQPTSPAPPVA